MGHSGTLNNKYILFFCIDVIRNSIFSQQIFLLCMKYFKSKEMKIIWITENMNNEHIYIYYIRILNLTKNVK